MVTSQSSEKRWIALKTLESDVPPLNVIGNALGILNNLDLRS